MFLTSLLTHSPWARDKLCAIFMLFNVLETCPWIFKCSCIGLVFFINLLKWEWGSRLVVYNRNYIHLNKILLQFSTTVSSGKERCSLKPLILHLFPFPFCQGKNAPGVKKYTVTKLSRQRGNYWFQILKSTKMNFRKKNADIQYRLLLVIDKIFNKSYFMLIFAWNHSSFLKIRWFTWLFGSLDGFNKCDISHFFFKLCSCFH